MAMEKTPVSRSRLFSRGNNNLSTGTSTANELKESANTACSTLLLDTKLFTDIENDDSPVHIACTQEGCENIDVVWDWNSPQTKQKPKRAQKRLILQSPKIPLKRYPSNNQNFEKLRGELQLLKEDISVPDNEDCLLLSPLQEAEYKDINHVENQNAITTLTQENRLAQDDEDLFNDSVDEQLVWFSQKIEADLNILGQIKFPSDSTRNQDIKDTSVQNSNKKSVCELTSVKVNNPGFLHIKPSNGDMAQTIDDSFDAILQDFKIEGLEVTKIINKTNINQVTKNISHSFPRTKSEIPYESFKQTNMGKVEFHRTQSFESTFEHNQKIIPQSKLCEIERNKKKALAKLESKRKQKYCSDSLMKCTPIEIEQKRLQALAKLEAKRQQDAIERKRQEALKRLELSRKKNATIVKSSLTKRL